MLMLMVLQIRMVYIHFYIRGFNRFVLILIIKDVQVLNHLRWQI